jgi:hypothetical protein
MSLASGALEPRRGPSPPPPEPPPGRRKRLTDPAWADLMRRTFETDVLACPRCGGRLVLSATIEGRQSSRGSSPTWDCRSIPASPPRRARRLTTDGREAS